MTTRRCHMKSFIQYIKEVSYTPTKSKEYDEVKYQRDDSKTKEGKPYYSRATRSGLRKLGSQKKFDKALKKSKTTTMTRGELEKTGNFDSRVTGLDRSKVKRVSGQFKSGEVERPVVMQHRRTGERHMLGGNTRAAIGSSRKHGGKGDVQTIRHGRPGLPGEASVRRVGSRVGGALRRGIGSIANRLKEESAAWQRKEGKNKEGGLNAAGRKSYERENPGSDLKAPVSAAQAKKSKGGKAAKRRKSFCARMGGMPGPMKDSKGRPTRKALALDKWDC